MFIKRWLLAFALITLLTLAVAACSSGESPSEPISEDREIVARETGSGFMADMAPLEDSQSGASSAPAAQPASAASPAPTVQPAPASAPETQAYRSNSSSFGSSRPSPTSVPEAMMSEPAVKMDSIGEAERTVEKAVEVPAEQAAEAADEPSTVAYRSSTQAQGPAGAAGAQGAPAPTALPASVGTASSQSSGSAPTPAPSTAAKGSASGQSQPGATTFQDNQRRPTISTYDDAVSTFSLDTDRTSYRLALNWAREGYEIEPDSVRAEEWINSFGYGYDHPSNSSEFAIHTDVFQHPLEGNKYIARVGIQAPDLEDESRPLNVTLVLDASGSMAEGNRIAIAREAADTIRQSLRSQDRIAVVHFSDRVLQGLTVRHTNPKDDNVFRSIQRLQPGGATNVQAGLNQGVQLADDARRRRPDSINYVILMSDGVANVDATNPFAILETAGDYNNQNPLRLVTIGVGIANYNDYLLEQLAQHGNGWYRYLDNVQQAQVTFSEANWLNLAVPFADQTRAQVTWNPNMVRTWRIVGYENRVTADELFTQNRREFAEIPSGAATTVFYELELTDQVYQRQASSARLGDIELRWVEPGSGASREQYDVVSGHWRQDFDALGDPLLRMGTVVALAADRYSGLPYSGYAGYSDANWELSELQRRLRVLQNELGHLTAYSDFTLLLDHMTRFVPPDPPRPQDSGYSP